MTPEQLFADLLGREPARPFVTYYDEASGERTELSVRSLANWVAKTHHLLTTELGLGPGDRAALDLPAHWISVPVLLGALTAGLTLGGPDTPADAAFVTAGSEPVDAADIFVISPERAAVGLSTPPDGTADYVTAVRPQADAWGSVHLAAGADDPFTDQLTRGAAVQAAQAVAAGWPPGARVLCTRDWAGPDDWIATVLAPLAVGGSVVFVRNSDDAAVLDRRGQQERCTARLD